MVVNNSEAPLEGPPSLQAHGDPSPKVVGAANLKPNTSGTHKINHIPAIKKEEFSRKILNVGFFFALLLAGACLLMGGVYLYKFLNSTNDSITFLINNVKAANMSGEDLHLAIQARTVVARIALLSCGVFVGMAFGFLGFALFLIGIKEEMNLDAGFENYRVKLARLSPGVFVILCSTILIGVCVTHSTPFDYNFAQQQPTPSPTPAYKPPPVIKDNDH